MARDLIKNGIKVHGVGHSSPASRSTEASGRPARRPRSRPWRQLAEMRLTSLPSSDALHAA